MPVRDYEKSILYCVRVKNGEESFGVTTNLVQRKAQIKRGVSAQHNEFIVAHGG